MSAAVDRLPGTHSLKRRAEFDSSDEPSKKRPRIGDIPRTQAAAAPQLRQERRTEEAQRPKILGKRKREEEIEVEEAKPPKCARLDARPIAVSALPKKRKAEEELSTEDTLQKRARKDDHKFVAIDREVAQLAELLSKMMLKESCREKPGFFMPRYIKGF